jgi:GT2 family glycosyltransferase/glycosyltransferase involved in cell wall biosynthesis
MAENSETDRSGAAERVARVVAPTDSKARALLRVGRQLARDGREYAPRFREVWESANDPIEREPHYADWATSRRGDRAAFDERVELGDFDARRVLVEVLVLAERGSKATDLRLTVDSLLEQWVPDWNATIFSAERTDAPADGRIKVVEVVGDSVFDQLASHALEGESDAFLVVLEAGDQLEPDFIHEVISAVWDATTSEVVHWDDDLRGRRTATSPRFRPSWSPELLLSSNPLGRSFAVSRAAVRRAGGLRSDLGDAAWWALLLALDLDAGQVARIPRVLAHLDRRPRVTSSVGAEVVSGALVRRGLSAQVVPFGSAVRVVWDLPSPPHVTVIIPTRHNVAMMSNCLPTLAATDYPSFDVLVVDNGVRSPEAEQWYADNRGDLDLEVIWWDEEFNYSRVNNVAAAKARGEVLLFLNDDTEAVDPEWMREMVSWTQQPEIGLVGLQLFDGDGRIQHGGVVIGVNGFADHLFVGLEPHTDTIFGSTDWYRNTLSVTGACVAVRREVFEKIGGFDELFVLCGSDVVLGLDTRFLGLRNVVSPMVRVRHLESVTRGTSVPSGDFFASYWRYQKYLRGGDPYFSPQLSNRTGAPQLARRNEVPAVETVGPILGRNFAPFRQTSTSHESEMLAKSCRADDALVDSVRELHASAHGPLKVRSINWYFPDIDSPFYGGINTALRIADHLQRTRGVRSSFVIQGNPNPEFFRSALAAAFPALLDSEIHFLRGPDDPELSTVPYADVSIATLWVTAYTVARATNTARKFYLIQDFEPSFYPAGTNYALCEESYLLGLYGLCNTQRLLDIMEGEYRGSGGAFMPAVDQSVFHDRGRRALDHDGPVTVFMYARPGHWRNCWEIAEPALLAVKARFGSDVRIVTAGSWATPDALGMGITHLGMLDYRDTGELYRQCDVGIALTLSAHPSYLPLELMACGVPVVAFDNPAGDWILRHGVNSLRCRRTVDSLAHAVGELVADPAARVSMGAAASRTIAERFSSWTDTLDGVYDILADPQGWKGPAPGAEFP